MNQLDPRIYSVAWLAPLEIEARAALHMLDHRHRGRFPLSRGDDYVFLAGEMCGHNVIIATLPAGQEYGTGSAAALASQVKRFFPNLWFSLLVGVAAGLPNLSRLPPLDIRLGDVLVGLEDGQTAAVIAYDLGKETAHDGFQLLRGGHAMASTETVLKSAIGSIKLQDMNDAASLLPYYDQIRDQDHSSGTFIDPGQEHDALYEANDDGTERLVQRPRRPSSRRTRVWYGPIGSGEKLMKNAQKRNQLRDKYNIIGLEMEAAGAMNRINVGIIRGVCDYGDEHKNKIWQPYAAAMAAAYAKAVLAELSPKTPMQQQERIMENTTIMRVVDRRKRPLDEQSLSITDCRPRNRRSEDNNTRLLQVNHGNIQAVSGSTSGSKTKELLDSLRFEQIDSRYEAIENEHRKTCQWLLDTPSYRDWLDPSKLGEHHGFLWIEGKPGAGKSTLMKFTLERTREKINGTIISFFFNARGADLEKSTIGMFRSLLLQVLERIPRLQDTLRFPRLVTEDTSEVPQWSIKSLKDLFEQVVQGLGKSSLVCFIDALNECNEVQIREMVSFFEGLGELATSNNIVFQVCFSSRHYPRITISPGIRLDLDKQEGHSQDIVSYIGSKLKIGRGKLAEEIRKELTEKASGVFMWIVLAVGILQREHDHGGKRMLKQKLQDIPGDLHELFRDILTRDSYHKDRLLLCLQWLLFTRRPLTPEQLYLAVLSGIDSDDSEAIPYWKLDEIEDGDIRNFILSSSKGLAEITGSKENPTVQFIHESVRDFLLKENGFEQIWSIHSSNFTGESHERLKRCCLNYMRIGIEKLESNLRVPDAARRPLIRQEIVGLFPFLEYAVRNVFHHADEAEAGNVNQTAFVQDFQVAKWVQVDNILGKPTTYRHSRTASLLYVLSEYNAANLISRHPDKLSCFDEEGERYGAPILAALATGSRDAVLAFVNALMSTKPIRSPIQRTYEEYGQRGNGGAGICQDFKFSRYRSVFSYLAEFGEGLLMALALISGNYDIEILERGGTGVEMLEYAAQGGHVGTLKLLIDYGARIKVGGYHGRTALSWAAGLGHYDAVRFLLESDISIEDADSALWPPLTWAASAGHTAIVELLLERGAFIETTDLNGQTPLSNAAKNGHNATVGMLLQYGALIEASSFTGITPLSFAASVGDVKAVQLLLERGANIHAVDHTGRTPLLHAVTSMYGGTCETIRLLLNHDANIEAADNSGRTSLSFAASIFHDVERMSLLLSLGAKIDAADHTGRTALSWAVTGESIPEVVSFLLSQGAKVDAADDNGRTPLSWAVSTGWETRQSIRYRHYPLQVQRSLKIVQVERRLKIVQVLVALHDARIEAKDKNGKTPLWWAATASAELWKTDTVKTGMVTLLLDHGADINCAPDERLDVNSHLLIPA